MPGFDGTGPTGMGPITGRGLGPCGRGFGFRRGFGRRILVRGAYPQVITEKEEAELLKEELEALREEIKQIEKRLKELK